MFSKKKRVTKELFQEILTKGRTLSSPLFTFRYLSSQTLHYAFVAPKSVSKQAVGRNKLRRQGYFALRGLKTPVLAGIFFYKKGVKNPEYKDIKADIESILGKIKI